jgi:hypothetical protein
MGDLIDLDKARAERKAKEEEEKKQAKLEDLEYMKSVLEAFMEDLPAMSGTIYTPLSRDFIYEPPTYQTDDPYYYDSTQQDEEEDPEF